MLLHSPFPFLSTLSHPCILLFPRSMYSYLSFYHHCIHLFPCIPTYHHSLVPILHVHSFPLSSCDSLTVHLISALTRSVSDINIFIYGDRFFFSPRDVMIVERYTIQ